MTIVMRTNSRSRQAGVANQALLDVRQVANLLGCSTRHVCRLSEAGLMPSPVRLGKVLIRYRRDAIELWIANGCPPTRSEAPTR